MSVENDTLSFSFSLAVSSFQSPTLSGADSDGKMRAN